MAIRFVSDVLQHSTATGTAKLMLVAIADKADEKGLAYPGNAYLARICNIQERQVQYTLKKLVEEGHLEVVDDGGRGPGNPRIVRVHSTAPLVSEKGALQRQIRVHSTAPNTLRDTKTIDQIYEAYPRHVGKRKAYEKIEYALRQLAKDGIDNPAEWLLDRVKMFAASPAGQAGSFTPHPATWFHQARYFDDPSEWTRRKDEPERGAYEMMPRLT